MTIKTVGRPPTGEVIRRWRKRDRQWFYAVRFSYVHPDTGQRLREYLKLGLETEGWNEPLADAFLDERLEEAHAGVYRPAVAVVGPGDRDPLFHEFATDWLEDKQADLSGGAQDDYRNLLVNHLLPFFARYRLSEITFDLVLEYRTKRAATSRALHDAKRAGQPLTYRRADGKKVPKRIFGARQINASIALLARILARAIKLDAYDIDRNGAIDPELRVKSRRPAARRHLEADEVVELLAAALELDNPVSPDTVERAEEVRRLRDRLGRPWKLIGAQVGCAPSTAIWLYRRHPDLFPQRDLRAAIALLTLAGGRNQETAVLEWDEIDFSHQRIVVDESKSRPREIEMSPFLTEEMLLYRHSLAVTPSGHDLVLCTREGQPRTRHNLNNNVLKPVVKRANQRRRARGEAPLPPNITPHTLRRSFVTMSAQRGRSLSWIVHQIGHDDYTTTLRYYQQATSSETLPHILEHLELLFGRRPVVGLDELDALLRSHDTDERLRREPTTPSKTPIAA